MDHQEDTQGAVLSHNHCRINHITKSFMVILAKKRQNLSQIEPFMAPWVPVGVRTKIFFMKYDSTDQDVSFL